MFLVFRVLNLAFTLGSVQSISQLLSDNIRDVADFPKPGILFKDISPVLSDPALLRHSINELTATSGGKKIDKVVGIDARGFIFAAPVALNLDAGFVPVRKKGKLPPEVIRDSPGSRGYYSSRRYQRSVSDGS